MTNTQIEEKYLNKIIQGDCLEVLKQLPDKSIDLILQDPPYFTTACKWEWDIMTKIDEFWLEWKRVIKDNGAIVMTASQPFTSKLVMSNLKMFKYEWVWDKKISGNPLLAKHQPLKVHENIVVFSNGKHFYNPEMRTGKMRIKGGGKSKLLDMEMSKSRNDQYYPISIIESSNAKRGLHPTQKPVALMEYLIKTYTNEGDTVFDGFAGSGTTAVACKNLNRNFIGVELDETYAKVAQERIDSIQPSLLTPHQTS